MSTPDTRTSDVESAAKTIMEDVKRHVEAVKVASFTEIYPIIEIYAEKSLTSFREKAVAEERGRLYERNGLDDPECWHGKMAKECDASQCEKRALLKALTPPKDTNK